MFLQGMEAKGWQDERLKAMVLEALALHASAERDEAVRVLAGALVLAEPGGFIRLFLDVGPPMPRLLSEAAASCCRPRQAKTTPRPTPKCLYADITNGVYSL